MLRIPLTALVLFSAIACQASSPVLGDVDPAQREALFAPVCALEGTWALDEAEHPGEVTFTVSSAGSTVREIMFPGTPSEMTNMYALDGNSLVMTHYCAGGNQPTMRAGAIDQNRIVFAPESVKDLREGYGHYMAGMTLVILDENRIEQHWMSFDEATGESGTTVFELTRQ